MPVGLISGRFRQVRLFVIQNYLVSLDKGRVEFFFAPSSFSAPMVDEGAAMVDVFYGS
jgi:hypothetical protein